MAEMARQRSRPARRYGVAGHISRKRHGLRCKTERGGYSVPPPSTLRAELHAIIDRAFALLDQLDGDPGLEDGGDAEPSLACPEGREYQVVLPGPIRRLLTAALVPKG